MSRFRRRSVLFGAALVLGCCVFASAQQGNPPATGAAAPTTPASGVQAQGTAVADPFAAFRQPPATKKPEAAPARQPYGAQPADYRQSPPVNTLRGQNAGSIRLTAVGAEPATDATPPGQLPPAAASEAMQMPTATKPASQPYAAQPNTATPYVDDRYSGSRFQPTSTTIETTAPGTTPTQPFAQGQTLGADAGGNASTNFAAPAATGGTGVGKPGDRDMEGPQSPSLTLEKVAPPEVQVGKQATFELHVRNIGTVPAHDVLVEDDVPTGAQFVSSTPKASRGERGRLGWNVGTLKPGDEVVIRVELVPTGEGEIGSVATVTFAAAVTSRTRVTRPELALEVVAPKDVLIGEDLVMRIRVSNTGTGVATGVVLSNLLPVGLSHPAGGELEYEVGDLPPGEMRELDLELKASKAGAAVNRLVARGDGQLQVEKQTQLAVLAPGLDVALDGPRKRYLDRQATYTVSVMNPGTAAAHEVELVTYLPQGLDFVEANNSGQYDAATRTVRWLLDELPPQERGSVTLTTLPVEAGEQPLKITSSARQGLAVEKRETLLVEGVAAILFEVVDVADPIEVGGETSYEIRVVNQGSKAATNVQIVAVLPNELKATGADGPTRYELTTGQVRFHELAQLAPKAETAYRIRVQGAVAGDARIRVQLTTDDIRAPITKEESTRIYSDQ